MKSKFSIAVFLLAFLALYAVFFILPRYTYGENRQVEGKVASLGAHQSATGSTVYYMVATIEGKRYRIAPILTNPLRVGDQITLELKSRILLSDMAVFLRKNTEPDSTLSK